MRGLHKEDGTDSTADLDGDWDVFEGIGLCEDFEGEFLQVLARVG